MAGLPFTQTQVGAITQSTVQDTPNANTTAPRTQVIDAEGAALNVDPQGRLKTAHARSSQVTPPTGTLTVNADSPIAFAQAVSKVVIQNKTNVALYYDFDTPASPGSLQLDPGALVELDVAVTTMHFYSSVAAAVNGSAAGNVIVKGWL